MMRERETQIPDFQVDLSSSSIQLIGNKTSKRRKNKEATFRTGLGLAQKKPSESC